MVNSLQLDCKMRYFNFYLRTKTFRVRCNNDCTCSNETNTYTDWCCQSPDNYKCTTSQPSPQTPTIYFQEFFLCKFFHRCRVRRIKVSNLNASHLSISSIKLFKN